MSREHPALHRVGTTRSEIRNPHVPITLYANDQVHVEADAVEQILTFAALGQTIGDLWDSESKRSIEPFWGEHPGALRRIVLTPDFHRGSGIPVGTVAEAEGFVIPQAVGNDVCCGM